MTEFNKDDRDPFVVVETFVTLEEVEVARGLLQSAGIDCVCPDEYTSYARSPFAIRPRLMVPQSQLASARDLLDSFEFPELLGHEPRN